STSCNGTPSDVSSPRPSPGSSAADDTSGVVTSAARAKPSVILLMRSSVIGRRVRLKLAPIAHIGQCRNWCFGRPKWRDAMIGAGRSRLQGVERTLGHDFGALRWCV